MSKKHNYNSLLHVHVVHRHISETEYRIEGIYLCREDALRHSYKLKGEGDGCEVYVTEHTARGKQSKLLAVFNRDAICLKNKTITVQESFFD